MPAGCLLWFVCVFSLSLSLVFSLYFCLFSSTPSVRNSLPLKSIWWSDIQNFQGLCKLDHTFLQAQRTHRVPAELRLLGTLIMRSPHPPSPLLAANKPANTESVGLLWSSISLVLFDCYTSSNSAYDRQRVGDLFFLTQQHLFLHALLMLRTGWAHIL